MPYRDPQQQREYQRRWVAARRARYLADKCCVDCGSTDCLELDHEDIDQKVSHRIWSWSAKRREAELAKCVVRCRRCHQDRHAEQRRRHGIAGYQRRGCRCEVCRAAKREANRRYDERRRRDLHSRTRLCRPVPNSSATAPGEQLSLLDAA